MPSDFISLLSADLDLESPKSLYSRDSLKLHPSQNFHRAGLLEESVYDLLPKELQLPPSRETSVASMSQTSGGEAGSPPPAVVAAGIPEMFILCILMCMILRFKKGFASEAGSVCIKNDL
ncbi:NFAT5 isoform 11 [Pan troglodytes]|uniref:Nuclear factor of activated T cells 5 n=3 Tax=Hominidae TaxID=9604 RepID=H3BP21_HUMAN|nr:nuclear factor of activated T cells 5 [Homo sapiens]KAI4055800.1 nuclear factor of activated T cells 5 [Homo sapiens]PNI90947.1 NFAT5 isoform 11 [Pan troglodytes]PNJ61557.1 NFAT5 isoform 4 [Pongo abelii]